MANFCSCQRMCSIRANTIIGLIPSANFAASQHLTIDGWIEKTISGTKNYDKRALGKLLKKVKKDDLIICAELSRLGRNLFMIMEILNLCMSKECKV